MDWLRTACCFSGNLSRAAARIAEIIVLIKYFLYSNTTEAKIIEDVTIGTIDTISDMCSLDRFSYTLLFNSLKDL